MSKEKNLSDLKYYMAKKNLSQGNYQEAITLFEEAKKLGYKGDALNTNLSIAYYNEAVKKVQEKAYNDAIELFTKAENLGYTEGELYYNKGIAYYRWQVFIEAKKCFLKAESEDFKEADCYHYLGMCNRKLGNLEEAITNFEQALSIKVDDQILLYEYATALKAGSNHLKASEIYEQLLNKDSLNTEVRVNTLCNRSEILLLQENNDSSEVIKLLKEAEALLALEGNISNKAHYELFIYNKLGQIYLSLKKYDIAENYLNKAYAVNNNDIYCLMNLGVLDNQLAEHGNDSARKTNYSKKAIEYLEAAKLSLSRGTSNAKLEETKSLYTATLKNLLNSYSSIGEEFKEAETLDELIKILGEE
ncbi:MAG: NrfG5 [Rickettsiaceae bacterium]|jgi:tetratricopeptide (TPR) repeat protein|nr:NrfG5 [Rickettsiaceae bacterium]